VVKRLLAVGAAGAALAAAGALRKAATTLPEAYPPFPGTGEDLRSEPVPEGLPAPVSRYLKVVVGPRVPVQDSAVLSGRMRMRIKGVTLPGRWRFVHVVGTGYRHHMELTVLGRTVMTGREWYLDGHAELDLPVGSVSGEPTVDAAASISMWAEYLWLPSVLAHGDWQAIDDRYARLMLPGGDALLAEFNPDSGLIRQLEAMRWRDAGDPGPLRWVTGVQAWTRTGGVGVPAVATVQWGDQSQPWLRLSLDEVVWNADLAGYVRSSGV
jgi:hypothetical protein